MNRLAKSTAAAPIACISSSGGSNGERPGTSMSAIIRMRGAWTHEHACELRDHGVVYRCSHSLGVLTTTARRTYDPHGNPKVEDRRWFRLAVVRRPGARWRLPGNGHFHRASIHLEPASIRVAHPARPSPAWSHPGADRLLLPRPIPVQVLDSVRVGERASAERLRQGRQPPHGDDIAG